MTVGEFTMDQNTLHAPSRWARLSAFSKGLLGAIVGMIVTLLVAGLCFTAYQDHVKINSVVAYLNQVAAQQQQARPQVPPRPAETPAEK